MKKFLVFLLSMFLTLGLAWAVEVADLEPHMKPMAKAAKALQKQVASNDGAGAAASARIVALHMGHMEKIWRDGGVGDAADWSKEAADAAAKIASMSGDMSGAEDAMRQLMGTCKACHTEHRTKDADGNYGVK